MASTSPAFTFWPTDTLSVVRVPPETKFSLALDTVERLPEAETLD